MSFTSRFCISAVYLACLANYIVLPHSLPIFDENGKLTNETIDSLDEANDTHKDLIIIKTVVYEVGILTDSDDDADNSTETREEVDLTFFNPHRNGSTIDLSNIPLPIQTNVSGVSITGIIPGNLGTIQLPEGADENNVTFTSPVLPNAVVSVTHNVSTHNNQKTKDILAEISPLIDIPELAHINSVINSSNETTN